MPKNVNKKRTVQEKDSSKGGWKSLTPMEKADRILKITAGFLGLVVVVLVGSTVLRNYLSRWRYQQEMARMTTEINNRQTYGNESIVTYESLSSELRAAAISDGYTDRERAALLESYLGELMSYGDGDRFSIRVQTTSGYNVPEMLVLYTESESRKDLGSNEPADNTVFGESVGGDNNGEAESQRSNNTNASSNNSESGSSEDETDIEDTGQTISGEESGKDDTGPEEEQSDEGNRIQPGNGTGFQPGNGSNSVVQDIGLNSEISSGIPKKTKFDIPSLVKELEKAVKETEYGVCYLKTKDARGLEQAWYISDNLTLRLDTLRSTTPIQIGSGGLSGYNVSSSGEVLVWSGELPGEMSFEEVCDGYLQLSESIGDGVLALEYGNSYLYYVGDTARTCGFEASLQGMTDNQKVLRTMKFYSETQLMSDDFASFFGALLASFQP